MSKTAAEIVALALKELLVTGDGQTASPEDSADALGKFTSMLSKMRHLDIWRGTDDSTFSEEFVIPLTELLAEECAPTLGGRPRNDMKVMDLENQLLTMQNKPLIKNEQYVDPGLRQGRRWGGYDWTRS